jgi:hypothetical protein
MISAGTVATAISHGEAAVRVAVERAVADRREAGRHEPDPVPPEVDEQRDQRPDVEHHAERERRDDGSVQPARYGTMIRWPDDEIAGTR